MNDLIPSVQKIAVTTIRAPITIGSDICGALG
jgi:hypothetical protein